MPPLKNFIFKLYNSDSTKMTIESYSLWEAKIKLQSLVNEPFNWVCQND